MVRESEKLTSAEFQILREFLSHEYGLFFEPSKMTFLENRVIPLLKTLECETVSDFITNVRNDSELQGQLLDAVTTNETWFFRHPNHFEILREDVLPVIIANRLKEGQKHISIWSAGCSIGAEAYSIAITLHEVLKNITDWNIRILGSDISRKSVNRANIGVYYPSELRLISNIILSRYFIPLPKNEFKVKTELQRLATFKLQNLLDPWEEQFFDIIFCRNTMIYFKDPTKVSLTQRLFEALNQNGVFFISATETLHWPGEPKFTPAFLKGEYIFFKTIPPKMFILYQFQTPSDLLRAVNVFVKEKIEFRLSNISPSNQYTPNKAVEIPKESGERAEEMFKISGLSFSFRKEISR